MTDGERVPVEIAASARRASSALARRTVASMKLSSVIASIDDIDHLTVHVRWKEGPVPRDGSVLWVLPGLDPAGRRFDFGYKLVDRAPSALYMFDFESAHQTNVPLPVIGDYDGESGSLSARLPWPDEFDFATWRWEKAVLNIDGVDVSRCIVSTT
jgi:hypothetical protein